MDGEALVGDSVILALAGWSWTGVLVDRRGAAAAVMDHQGRLCRHIDGAALLEPAPKAVHAPWLCRSGSDAIKAARRAPSSPSGLDLWMLPLIASDRELAPLAKRYYGWDAKTRLRLERALDIMGYQASPRQCDVARRVLLGPVTVAEAAKEARTTPDNIRMARMRALRMLRTRIGSALDA